MTDKPTACRVCGTQTTENLEVIEAFTPAGHPNPGENRTIGTCSGCATLRMNEVGAAVRACLRLLGKPEDQWPMLATVLADMEIDPTGVLASRSPTFRRGPTKPFSHIDRATKSILRQAYATVLADRVAATQPQPEPVPTPPEPQYPQGCCGCGIGLSVEWHGPVLSSALTPGPEMVTGVVCSDCAQALRDVGAVGPSWLERAVMQAKGLAWTPSGVRSWLSTGLPPQTEPWGWMDVGQEPLTLDPVTALQSEVADLQGEVASLRSEVAALRREMVPVP